jgi:hypothetical protein
VGIRALREPLSSNPSLKPNHSQKQPNYNDGYDARTLRELMEIVEANKDRIERAWNEFFG